MYYHVWFVTKYRKTILEGKIGMLSKEAFLEVAREKTYNILEMGINKDHVHMLMEAVGKEELAGMLRTLKAVSARKIHKTPHLRVGNTREDEGYYRRKPVEVRRSFWARRYGYRKIGEKEIEYIREYIRNQKNIPHGQ